jgi:hypothetical protein
VELSRIVQCFLDGSGEETLSEALCRAVLNAKNTRLLIRSRLDTPSLAGAPVECEFSLRSFFDEYEEPLLYAIFGDTRITFHAVKTGPNTASVTLKFRHSFEWKDIMRNDLEKFFDTPQEKSGWIYRSTKLVGNISDENYELNDAGRVASYKLQVTSSGENAEEGVASSGENAEEGVASSGGAAAELIGGSGEAATNPTGGPTSGAAGEAAPVNDLAASIGGASTPSTESAEPPTASREAATNPTGGPTGGTGVPSLQNMPGGPELLRNRIFDAFLRHTPDFKMTMADMQLLLNSEALALRFRAYPPSGEPQKARLVFEEDKDNELYFALGEAYVYYYYDQEDETGEKPGSKENDSAQPELSAAQIDTAAQPARLLRLEIFHHWEWIDLMRNGFDKYFPETKQRAEYAYSSLDVKGSATVEGMPAEASKASDSESAMDGPSEKFKPEDTKKDNDEKLDLSELDDLLPITKKVVTAFIKNEGTLSLDQNDCNEIKGSEAFVCFVQSLVPANFWKTGSGRVSFNAASLNFDDKNITQTFLGTVTLGWLSNKSNKDLAMALGAALFDLNITGDTNHSKDVITVNVSAKMSKPWTWNDILRNKLGDIQVIKQMQSTLEGRMLDISANFNTSIQVSLSKRNDKGKWNIKYNKAKRAPAIPEQFATIEALAEIIGLDAASCEKWLKLDTKEVPLGSAIIEGGNYSIPNTWICANLLKMSFKEGVIDSVVNFFASLGGDLGEFVGTDIMVQGMHVVKADDFDKLISEIKAHKGDIWGIIIYAHGNASGAVTPTSGMSSDKNKQKIRSQEEIISALNMQGFKLSKSYARQCESFRTYTDKKNNKTDWKEKWEDVSKDPKGHYGYNVLTFDLDFRISK